MGLVEKSENFVARFELCDTSTDTFDCACAIGAGDDIVFDREGVFALLDTQRVLKERK